MTEAGFSRGFSLNTNSPFPPALASPSPTFYKSYLTPLTMGLKHASYCLPQTLVIKGRDSGNQIEERNQEAGVGCGFINNSSSASPNPSSLQLSSLTGVSLSLLSGQPWSKEAEPLTCHHIDGRFLYSLSQLQSLSPALLHHPRVFLIWNLVEQLPSIPKALGSIPNTSTRQDDLENWAIPVRGLWAGSPGCKQIWVKDCTSHLLTVWP